MERQLMGRRIILVPHPDDEILFLYSYVKDRRKSDLYYSVTLPKGVRAHYWARVFGGASLCLEDKGKYVDGEYAGADLIPRLDEALDSFKLEMPTNDRTRIIIPGTNHLYGHKHHIQLCNAMYDKFVFIRKFRKRLDYDEQERKEEMFLKEYPDQKHILKQKDIRDYLDLGVEVALVFGVN